MSPAGVPARVRFLLWLYYAGIIAGALGIVGFIVSFGQVGSAAQAAIDVHKDIPVLAYASIAAWLVGLAFMWYGRRGLGAAGRERMRQDPGAVRAGADPSAPDREGE